MNSDDIKNNVLELLETLDSDYRHERDQIIADNTFARQKAVSAILERLNSELSQVEEQAMQDYRERLLTIQAKFEQDTPDNEEADVEVDEGREPVNWGAHFQEYAERTPYSLTNALDVLAAAVGWDRNDQPLISEFSEVTTQILGVLDSYATYESGQSWTDGEVLQIVFEFVMINEPATGFSKLAFLDVLDLDQQVNYLLLVNLLSIFDGLATDAYGNEWVLTASHDQLIDFMEPDAVISDLVISELDDFVTLQGVLLADLMNMLRIEVPEAVQDEVKELEDEVAYEN